MLRCPSIAIAVLGLAACLWPQSLKKVGAIDLPGPKGQRFDYLTADDEDRDLLSAHLGPGILYVIDLRTDTLVKAIPGVPGITGLEYVPGEHNHGMALDSERHRAFLLCGGNRTFTVFALDTHKAIAHFPLPAGADVVKFDPGTG